MYTPVNWAGRIVIPLVALGWLWRVLRAARRENEIMPQ